MTTLRTPWHSWFAWRPVKTINHRWAWATWVDRRLVGEAHRDYYGDGATLYTARWEYRHKLRP